MVMKFVTFIQHLNEVLWLWMWWKARNVMSPSIHIWTWSRPLLNNPKVIWKSQVAGYTYRPELFFHPVLLPKSRLRERWSSQDLLQSSFGTLDIAQRPELVIDWKGIKAHRERTHWEPRLRCIANWWSREVPELTPSSQPTDILQLQAPTESHGCNHSHQEAGA